MSPGDKYQVRLAAISMNFFKPANYISGTKELNINAKYEDLATFTQAACQNPT